MEKRLPFTIPQKKLFFKNRKALTQQYIPPTLPGREKQIRDLQFSFLPALKKQPPHNLLIYGKPGSGKTAVVKHVIKQLNEALNQKKIENTIPLYIRCPKVLTETQALRLLLTELTEEHIPIQGWGISRYYEILENMLEKEKIIYIIVLDEIDKLKGEMLLYNLTRVEKNPPTIVGISNDLRFVERLDPRIVSSFGEQNYVFPPYNATELRKILNQRAKLALREDVLSEDVIPLCAALAAQEHGDARKAINLLCKSVEIAQYEGKKVSEEHLMKAQKNIEANLIKRLVEKLPLKCKISLFAVTLNKKSEKKSTATDIYKMYRKLSEYLSIPPVSRRRFTDYINELEMLGIVDTKILYMGRYGKATHIYLKSEREAIEKTLLLDESIAELKDYGKKWF